MTTTPPPGGDWSDERLGTAFSARAAMAPPTPPDLADSVLARVPAANRGDRHWSWLLVAAAVVAVTVALGGSAILGEHQPGPSGSPVAGSGRPPTAQPTTEPPNPILEALGDPVTVSEALANPDAMQAHREIVVRGFLSRVPEIYCAIIFPPRNPTRPECPESHRWLMEQPEHLWSIPASPNDPNRPTGPAFHVSFALVNAPVVPLPQEGPVTPLPVVLLGHFHDRRADLCAATDRQACGETFVVDRVLEVDGEPLPVRTARRGDGPLTDIQEDLDALVAGAAPGAIVESRQVVTVQELFDIEPVLRTHAVLSAWDPAALMWVVTAVDLEFGKPAARTFVLIDDSDWFAEVTADGSRMLDRTAAGPSGDPPSPLPTGDPTAFDSAPTSILGIPVRDIATLQREQTATVYGVGSRELAIRAWYLGPPPGVACVEPVPEMHEPRPPCDEARHWLLDDPGQYGVEQGQRRSNPAVDHYPPVLNPLMPIDVPFDVGDTWRGETALPRPVIVLGHFEDERVNTYAGNLYFVIDALAWTPDRPSVSMDTVVRLTGNASEDVAEVLARTAEVVSKDAVATWVTVVNAADFALLDRRSADMPEFTSGAPVWTVARLVHDETDGGQRLAVEWSWTADGGQRVWWTKCPDCSPDLGTALDIRDLDGNTPLVRVLDYDQVVTSVGPATGLGPLEWQQPHGNATDWMDVARGGTAREVVLRWTSQACTEAWDITVREFDKGRIYFSPSTHGDECEAETVVRRIVIEFDHPVDIDKIDGPSCCG